MGRHSRPSHTLRNTLVVTSALAGTAALFATPTASADTLDGCTTGARNPDVRVCQDNPYTDGSDSLHALAKVNPLLCVHVTIPDGRRAVGTRDCSHPAGFVPVIPVVPVAPGGTVPCSCTTTPGETAPAAPVAPVTSPGGETAPPESAPAPEAPAPTIINNNTATSPLPAVTH